MVLPIYALYLSRKAIVSGATRLSVQLGTRHGMGSATPEMGRPQTNTNRYKWLPTLIHTYIGACTPHDDVLYRYVYTQ